MYMLVKGLGGSTELQEDPGKAQAPSTPASSFCRREAETKAEGELDNPVHNSVLPF